MPFAKYKHGYENDFKFYRGRGRYESYDLVNMISKYSASVKTGISWSAV
jgi:hypothetical protein